MRPLGHWTIDPPTLISGEQTVLELRYRNGDIALDPDAWFRFDLEPISVKQTLFCPMSEDFDVVAWEGPAPKIRLEHEAQTATGYMPVRLTLPEGIAPGQSFAIRFGNRQENGDIAALVMPSPVHDLAFNMYSGDSAQAEEIDWFEAGWTKALPRCSIEAGGPSRLRIFAPSLVEAGRPFSVRVAVTDEFDSAAHPPYAGEVRLEGTSGDLPDRIVFAADERCSRTVHGVALTVPGVHRITGHLGGRAFESNPIVVREHVDLPIYWGLLHGHDWHSECWGDGADNFYRFGRDISGLDYLGLSDHINTTPKPDNHIGRLHPYRTGTRISARDAFLENVRAAERHLEPGVFVTLIGYEMSPYSPLHHNIFWADADEDNFERLFIDTDGVLIAGSEANLRDTSALIVPHMHARYVAYNQFTVGSNSAGAPMAPVVEGYSDWGMCFHPPGCEDELIGGLTEPLSRPFYEWVGRGIKVGFVADSDTHTGLPARRHPGSPSPPPNHFRPQGITAVRALELSRDAIVDAYRSRWTYGTSGERIFLDVSAEGVPMGQVFSTDQPFVLRVETAGTDVIERVGVYGPAGLLVERSLGDVREVVLEFELDAPSSPETPLFVEVVQANHHRAWSSPIWVRNSGLPNLVWQEGEDGRPRLVNTGSAPAFDVMVTHDPEQHPFTLPAIAHPAAEPLLPHAKVWTHRWDDHRVTVFFMWRGFDLAGTFSISGAQRYEVEMEPVQAIVSPVVDDGLGVIAFATWPDGSASTRLMSGFNVTVWVSHREPCRVAIELATETNLHVGDERVTATRFELPLNGLSGSELLPRSAIGDLGPGETWVAPSASGFWAADPDNEIAESDEAGHLHHRDAG